MADNITTWCKSIYKVDNIDSEKSKVEILERIAVLRLKLFYEISNKTYEELRRMTKNACIEMPGIISSWLMARLITDTCGDKNKVSRSIEKLEESLQINKPYKRVVVGVNNRQLGFQCLNTILLAKAIKSKDIEKVYFYADPSNVANVELLKSTVKIFESDKKIEIIIACEDVWNLSLKDDVIYIDDFTAYTLQEKNEDYTKHHEAAMNIWLADSDIRKLWKKIVSTMRKSEKSPVDYQAIKEAGKLSIAVGLRTSKYKNDAYSDLLRARNASAEEIEMFIEIATINKHCIFMLMNNIDISEMPENIIDISDRDFEDDGVIWRRCDGYIGSSSGVTTPFVLHEKPCLLLGDYRSYPEGIIQANNICTQKILLDEYYHARDTRMIKREQTKKTSIKGDKIGRAHV